MEVYLLNVVKGASALVWQIRIDAPSVTQALHIASTNGFQVLAIFHIALVRHPPLVTSAQREKARP